MVVDEINQNLKNAHSALHVCDKKLIPIVRKLYILVKLPVTTAT